jgi:hypothetical protein
MTSYPDNRYIAQTPRVSGLFEQGLASTRTREFDDLSYQDLAEGAGRKPVMSIRVTQGICGERYCHAAFDAELMPVQGCLSLFLPKLGIPAAKPIA